ncbi:MAG: hypothetical protein ACE5RN_03710 [Nitrosopumilaceae archaeon]
MAKTDYESKVIVLNKKIDDKVVQKIVEGKKTNVFKSILKKPKNEQVHIHSINLYYEAILMVSGVYTANFFRKAIHPIKVDYNVNEVVLGDGVFPIRTKSGLKKALSSKKGKNKVDLELEEHVFIENNDVIYLDHHGKEIEFPFNINSKSIENYPTRILNENKSNIKKPEITVETAIDILTKKLKKPPEKDVRDLKDEFTLNEVSEIYVPIYEARLIGPKKKVGILRIDAARNKIL